MAEENPTALPFSSLDLAGPELWLGMVLGAVAAVLLLLALRPLAWRLFSFDRRIRQTKAQVKSAEVRLGHLAETLAPLFEEFPVDLTKPGTSTVFLGRPVDYVHFDPDDGITLIEIKSAESQLSPKQLALRRRVEAGDVFWETLTIE